MADIENNKLNQNYKSQRDKYKKLFQIIKKKLIN